MLLSAYDSRRSFRRNDTRSVRVSDSRQEGSFAVKWLEALIAVCCSTVILTACGTSGFTPSPTGISGASPQRSNSRAPMTGYFKTLYTFKGGKDGAVPYAGLVALKGDLFGTTTTGGGTGCKGLGCGVVFSLSLKSHAERVLHAFRGGQDGASPYEGLLVVNGSLYGATGRGGSSCDCGTVFELNPSSGQEKVVHRFSKGRDGDSPYPNLVALDGKIYGGTSQGGSNRCSDGEGCGTIFQFDTVSQKLRVIHSFNGEDGAYFAYLTAFNGKLYGATEYGGGRCGREGCGTIFSLTPSSGVETVLYSFRGGRDGAAPAAPPVIQGQVIYGTTSGGGDLHCNNGEAYCGTLYTFDLASHKETVVHGFTGGSGGAYPHSALSAVGDEMYGTTLDGGISSDYSGYCGGSSYICGTIFSYLPKTKRFAVVHQLRRAEDGANPQSGLLALAGKLYGTASAGGSFSVGGSGRSGFGTVFAYRP